MAALYPIDPDLEHEEKNNRCETRGCSEPGTMFSQGGQWLCEDCMLEDMSSAPDDEDLEI